MPRRQLRVREKRDDVFHELVTSEGSKAGSLAPLTPGFATSTTEQVFMEKLLLVTPAPVVRQNLDVNAYYITLTVTNPTTTYTTKVLLGDNTSTVLPAPSPGLTTGDIIGIVIGVVGGVAVLLGVMYVYFLRLRVLGRTRVVVVKRRKRKSGSSSGSGSRGGSAPGPPPEAAPAA